MKIIVQIANEIITDLFNSKQLFFPRFLESISEMEMKTSHHEKFQHWTAVQATHLLE